MVLSGQKTVTTAGTAVQLGTDYVNAPVMIKALDTTPVSLPLAMMGPVMSHSPTAFA